MTRARSPLRAWLRGLAPLLLLIGGAGCASLPTGGSSSLLGTTVVLCRQSNESRSELQRAARIVPSGARPFTSGPPAGISPAFSRMKKRNVIDPVLARRIAESPPDRRVRVLVTLRERVEIPSFPALDENESRDSKTNSVRLAQAQALIRSIRARREKAYSKSLATLLAAPGAALRESFWLAPVYAIELPLGSVQQLLREPSVLTIEPVVGEDPPPACPDPPTARDGSPIDDVIEGLNLIGTESYRGLGTVHGPIALLDTGVWTSHTLLTGARLGFLGDCVHGGDDCTDDGSSDDLPGFDAGDQCGDGKGHGTSAAAILVGTDALGARWRGGLDLTLDSYQVDDGADCIGDCHACLNREAAGRAFEHARSRLVPVIVANICAKSEDIGSLCALADNAFRSGAVVVAANGSWSRAVEAPAAAPCVLGIGSRDLLALDRFDTSQNHGPAEGDRFKPDIQAPTDAETARWFRPCPELTGLMRSFAGTSGATPFAGVAAAMMRDFMVAVDPATEPGNVYAGMILAGRHSGANLNNLEGAGMIRLPSDCCVAFGTEEVSVPRAAIDVPFDLTASTADSVEAAIWWPQLQSVHEADDEPLKHNDIDLDLVDPDGIVRATSQHVWSVFERVTAPLTRRGVWYLRIRVVQFYGGGHDGDLPPDPNSKWKVYWAADARNR